MIGMLRRASGLACSYYRPNAQARPLMLRFPAYFVVATLAAFLITCCLTAEEPSKTDARYSFRTDFANAHLPWYQPKPGEFPPHHSDRRVSGELVSADFIHRTGQFRMSKNGELVDFTMPPYGSVIY